MKTRYHTQKRRLQLVLALWLTVGCLAEPFDGSTVVIDFLSDLDANVINPMADGSPSHYELWANFGTTGAYSIGRFVVDTEMHVTAFPDTETRIGSITGADDTRRSGVRFIVEGSLASATSMFVTLEPDDDLDVGPSGIVLLEGTIAAAEPTIMRGELSGEYQNRFGQVRRPSAQVGILLAEDNVQ